MKMRIILFLTICLSAVVVNAQNVEISVPNEVQPLIEKGSKAIALELADLNNDGLKDYILVLERENPKEKDEYDFPTNQRPLRIFIRGTDNKLSEAKRNERMVMCSKCGGIWGDPFAGITVGKKGFTVKHYGGSAWRWTADYKFNYSRIDKTWQLVQIEKTSYHNVRPMKETLEKTVLTPKDFGKVDIADFDPNAFSEETPDSQDTLVTANSAGKVKLGMTVAEVRNAVKPMTLSRTSDGEGIALISVDNGSKSVMTLYAGEEDPDAKLNNNAKVEFIEVWSSTYKTAIGVNPKMLVSEAEKKYGKVKEIMLSEIEAREYADFANQPKGIQFRLQNKNGMAGIYGDGERKTTRYSRGAFVASIQVVGLPIGISYFSSDYSDLKSGCKSEGGEEGGHVSTYCKGVGNYQIHYFDTARTLEFSAETKDGKDSVRLGSQTLDYPVAKRKIEWRMHSGVPFAVIMRTYRYQVGDDGLIEYPTKKIGEYLVVTGLKGFKHIDFTVNVKTTKNANLKARELANGAYAKNKSSQFKGIDVKDFNAKIDAAASANEAWVKVPLLVISRIVPPFSDMKSRTVKMEAPFADSGDSLIVEVIDDGYADDSVRGEKFKMALKLSGNGVWKVISAKKAQVCWNGRGHQDYSTVPCR